MDGLHYAWNIERSGLALFCFSTNTLAMDEKFLEILRCPISRQTLHVASDAMLARVNDVIEKGNCVSRSGEAVDRSLPLALTNEDETFLYAVFDEIPALTPDRAIVLDQFETSTNHD